RGPSRDALPHCAASAVPVPPLHLWVPPRMQPASPWEQRPLAFGCPENGAEKETFTCPIYVLSGIASGVLRSPEVQRLKHVERFPGHSRNGGLRRHRRRD